MMQNYYGNNQFYNNGMVPNYNQQMVKTTNWLSQDKINMLKKGLSQFRLSVTEEEMAKGQCNHYNSDGTDALIRDTDGSGGCTCAICGTHFNAKPFTTEEVNTTVKDMLDILNVIKIAYRSIDPNAALDFFQIIPFIEKIGTLFTLAMNDIKKYEGVDNFVNSQQPNLFNVFAMMSNPGMMSGQPMYNPQQQMWGQQMPNAGMAQQNPQYNPMYGQPMYQQQPMQQAGYQPQANGFAMNPMGSAAPQQPMYNTNMPNAMNPTGQVQQPVAQPQAVQQPAQQSAPQQMAQPMTNNNNTTVDVKFRK